MIDERYNRLMESMEPSQELIQKTLHARQHRHRPAGSWKPVMITALCVLLVAGAVALRVMTSSTKPPEIASVNAAPTFLPVSDELTLSVSDVTLVNDHELRFILTLQGANVDSRTDIDYVLEGLVLSGGSHHALEPTEGQRHNERRYQITLTNDDQHILAQAKATLQLSVPWYTTGSTYTETIHDINWSAITATELPRCGDPLIPLDGDIALSGLSYTEKDGLSVQVRLPMDSWETTHSFPQLILADTGEYPEKFILWKTTSYTADGYRLHNTTFQVTREELNSLQLVTYTRVTGRVITGDWRIAIDLTPLLTD